MIFPIFFSSSFFLQNAICFWLSLLKCAATRKSRFPQIIRRMKSQEIWKNTKYVYNKIYVNNNIFIQHYSFNTWSKMRRKVFRNNFKIQKSLKKCFSAERTNLLATRCPGACSIHSCKCSYTQDSGPRDILISSRVRGFPAGNPIHKKIQGRKRRL